MPGPGGISPPATSVRSDPPPVLQLRPASVSVGWADRRLKIKRAPGRRENKKNRLLVSAAATGEAGIVRGYTPERKPDNLRIHTVSLCTRLYRVSSMPSNTPRKIQANYQKTIITVLAFCYHVRMAFARVLIYFHFQLQKEFFSPAWKAPVVA